ncbi:hypothetical protein AQJ58_23375 [Streptomyces sp. DSM 15324]|nr:hypothetical protein AQJ58_23375 [Streptomyces sp. DSM 15324]
MTGGSTGIGQEIARRLAAEGADIAVADVEPADGTRALVERTGRRFFSAEVDVCDEDAVHAFAARVRGALGTTDILVRGRRLPHRQGVPAGPEGLRGGTDRQHHLLQLLDSPTSPPRGP